MSVPSQPEEPVAPPLRIERAPEEKALVIAWPDGAEGRLRYRELRGECMCARCVDELTGERIVDLQGIDPDVSAVELSLVGSYALKIRWSDGHDTGLYTWQHLRRLCQPA